MRKAAIIASAVFMLLAIVPAVRAQKNAGKPHRIETPKNRTIKAIEIFTPEGKPREAEGLPVLDQKGDIVIELDLGEPVAQIFRIVPREAVTFRMEQQYETSLTISDEGPHLDLRDWKHWTSDWKQVELTGALRFVPEEPNAENLPFPKVTNEEMVSAVRDLLKEYPGEDAEGWVSLVRQCKSPDDGPCIVTVSEVRLRISVLADGDWKAVQMVRLILPMGC